MNANCTSPGDLLSMRLAVLRELAQSMESSQFALTGNDAETIARGAAHQADLCRQWSLLEEQLRPKAITTSQHLDSAQAVSYIPNKVPEPAATNFEKEFAALTTRIRHLTRVHCSLLRHLHRSLAILGHLVDGCAPTYMPELNLVRVETRPQAGD